VQKEQQEKAENEIYAALYGSRKVGEKPGEENPRNDLYEKREFQQ